MPNRDYYENSYPLVHYQGAMGRFTRITHESVEKGLGSLDYFPKVLEIGAHTGEHIPFISHKFDEYVCLDIQPFNGESKNAKISHVTGDAEDLPFLDGTFDRVISVCVLHHIPRANNALTEIRRVAKSGALISLYVPCDPGILYRFIRHWTSHVKMKKLSGIPMWQVKGLWAEEHRGHALGILSMIRSVFHHDFVAIKRFPFSALSWNFNLFFVVSIKINKD